MTYILIFFLSLITAISFTPQLIKFLIKGGVIDYPDERKVHHALIPRMGGLVPIFIFLVTLIIFHPDLNSIRLLFIAFVVIISVGIYDDISQMKWYYKFVGQTGSTILLLFFLMPSVDSIEIFTIVLPPIVGEAVLGFFILGAINAVNLMDGMDGLVSGFALLVSVTVIGLLSMHFDPLIALIAFAVAGALLGYLKYNANPAQIFLGDTGSYFLGFILVFLSVKSAINFGGGVLDLAIPILLMAVPILDTLKVMVQRFINKKSMFLPDKTHLHHVLFDLFGEQKVTVFFILGLSTLFLSIAVMYLLGFYTFSILTFTCLVILFLFLKRILRSSMHVEQWLKKTIHAELSLNFVKKLFKIFLIPLNIVMTILLIVLSLPISSVFDSNTNLIVFTSFIVVFVLAVYRFIRYNTLHNIYVFINLFGFGVLSSISRSNGGLSWVGGVSSHLAEITIISVQLLIVMLFLFFKDRFIEKGMSFTGIDLLLIIFMTFFYALSVILQETIIAKYSSNAIIVLFLYLSYRLNMVLLDKYKVPLYFLSFIIIISASLITLLA